MIFLSSPKKEIKMPESWQTLLVKNEHPRDKHVRFYEPTHTYYIDGSSDKVISCTGFLHAFFPHFQPDETINKMMKKSNWPSSKYYGMTKEEIKAGWDSSGKEASGLGTAMHLAIEQYLNGAFDEIKEETKETKEWQYFLNFWSDHSKDLEPYRMEWEVWSKEHLLCGSIDGVLKRKSDGKYVIYDWKRSKEIKTSNRYEKGYAPMDHLDNCNYIHYSLQLNTYRWFLETLYGLEIGDMYIVIFHPNNKNYVRYRLPRLDIEVAEMLECRLRALENGVKGPIVLPLPPAIVTTEPCMFID